LKGKDHRRAWTSQFTVNDSKLMLSFAFSASRAEPQLERLEQAEQIVLNFAVQFFLALGNRNACFIVRRIHDNFACSAR